MSKLCRVQNKISYIVSAVQLKRATEVEFVFDKSQMYNYTLGKDGSWLFSVSRPQKSELLESQTDLIEYWHQFVSWFIGNDCVYRQFVKTGGSVQMERLCVFETGV